MANFSKGTGYSKSDLKGTGSPIILYGRLYTKYETIIRNVDSFVVPKSGSVFSKGGEVIVPGSGETAEDISIASVVEPAGVLLGGDLNIIYPNSDLDPTFLAITISNGKPHFDMARRAQGKSIVHLHNADLKHISLKTPNLSEQKRISKIFEVLDQTITLHEEKKRQLERLKSALLQKMFADKSGYPDIRFEDFSGEWEQRKVKDIFKITRGQVLAATETSEEKSDISPFPVYSSQTKNNGLMGYYKDYLFDTAITWTTDGANAGTVSYRSGRFYSTNVNGVLISDKGYANKAIAEILNLEAWKWVSHVGNPKLMNNVMGDISIMIPSSFEEQDRLSDFLNQLDHAITLQNYKIELVKKLKSFLLQNMFI